MRTILTNRVTITGAVDQPGDYALTSGMRVLDLIQRARGPLYDAYLDRADLTRANPDNTTTLISLDIARALDGDATQNIPLKRFDTLQFVHPAGGGLSGPAPGHRARRSAAARPLYPERSTCGSATCC